MTFRHMVVPDITTGATLERQLRKIATRGVVALFNAISKHQKESEKEEASKNAAAVAKKAKSGSKASFLELLKASTTGAAAAKGSGAGAGVDVAADAIEEKQEGSGGWGVLRDDYMMGAKANKDWDRVEREQAEGASDDGGDGWGGGEDLLGESESEREDRSVEQEAESDD